MQAAIEAGKTFLDKLNNNKITNNKSRSVLLVGHFDTDGLASTVIMAQALKKENIVVTKLIKQHIDDEIIEEISNYEEDIVFLVDLEANRKKCYFWCRCCLLFLFR